MLLNELSTNMLYVNQPANLPEHNHSWFVFAYVLHVLGCWIVVMWWQHWFLSDLDAAYALISPPLGHDSLCCFW